MLSRVAENIYWLGRYVERAENTARIVNVNANLLLDLPRGFSPGWQPLIVITGGEEIFVELHEEYDERNVIRFLVGESKNPGSILSSLHAARENTRTIRDIVPREAWEEINELYNFARDNLQSGLSKRGRYGYLKVIFRATQTLTGLLYGCMSHNEVYAFLRIGRNLERADMTSRIVDVRSASLLPEQSGLRPFESIQWVSVLKSLSAYQMYRIKKQVRIRRKDVLEFLMQDDQFPRAFYHCISEVESSLQGMPHNEAPLREVGRLKRAVQHTDLGGLTQDELQTFIDQLQIGLGTLHECIAKSYFLLDKQASSSRSSQSQTQTSIAVP